MIFILEDDPGRIGRFKEALGAIGYHLETNVPDAINWLEANKGLIDLYSLDNDILFSDYEGDPGEGWQLCDWIIANAPKRPIIVHTSNGSAAVRMRLSCDQAGWEFIRIAPFSFHDWIAGPWIRTVKKLVR